jgi:hypothetical protein
VLDLLAAAALDPSGLLRPTATRKGYPETIGTLYNEQRIAIANKYEHIAKIRVQKP